MGAALKIIWDVIKAIPVIIGAVRQLFDLWKQSQYDNRKEKFQEGTAERDQTKVEQGFGSDKAGKPSGHGRIVDE
jgi:hypothetical protein